MLNHKRKSLFYAPAFRYFVAVAEHESVRSASRELNVASSAVNRHLLSLERELGVKLFDRVGRRLRLSDAGRILRKQAQRALVDIDNAVASIDDLTGLKKGHVKLATVESVADSLLPDLIRRFQEKFPGIQVDIQIGSAASVTDQLLASDCHLAINFVSSADHAVAEICSFDLPVGAVTRKGHPLAKRSACTMRDCLKFPLSLPRRTLSVGRIVHHLLDKEVRNGAKLKDPIVKSNSLRLVRSFLQDTDYVAFQTHIGLQNEQLLGKLAFIPLADVENDADRLVLMRSASQELSLAPLEFAKHAEEALRNLIIGDRVQPASADG